MLDRSHPSRTLNGERIGRAHYLSKLPELIDTACVKWLAASAACAVVLAAHAQAARPLTIVGANGQIGSFRIDVTTEAQLRAVVGKPTRVENQFFPPKKRPVGHTLYYSCGSGCLTAYSINNATGKLSDFWTRSPHFVTKHGSRPGMAVSVVARREARQLLPGCGDGLYLHLRWDGQHVFVLTASGGRVTGITYLGPHSVYYDGLC
jgi:hypothetical protein